MKKIMGHFVLGYPDLDKSIEIAKLYDKTGIDYIECQIPFSDPSADGPVITNANYEAADISLENCFDALEEISGATHCEVVVMSYISRLYHYGIDEVFNRLKKSGISSIIIPDLPLDEAEKIGLVKLAEGNHINFIPVIALNTTTSRLRLLDEYNFPFYYLVSYFGTTGKSIGDYSVIESKIEEIKKISSKQIAVGFGIKNKNDVQNILDLADIAVLGSELIRKSGDMEELEQFLLDINSVKINNGKFEELR